MTRRHRDEMALDRGCRREFLDRTLVWNQAQLRRTLPAYEPLANRLGGPAGQALGQPVSNFGGAEGIRTLTPPCHGASCCRPAWLTVVKCQLIRNFRTLSDAVRGPESADDSSPLGSQERSQRQLEWNRQTRMDTSTATDAGPCPVPRAGVRRGSSHVASFGWACCRRTGHRLP